jgi:hypothetical protein
MAQDKYIIFFRNEINQELLIGTEERIDVLKKIPDLQSLRRLEGVDFFAEWNNLFDTLSTLWKNDIESGTPFFKMGTSLLDKLAFYLDFIAVFFLYNGSKEDNDYLINVDEFFKQHNLQRGGKETKELFAKAFKKDL